MVLDKNGKPLVAATATHPGEVLADELEARDMTQRELAEKIQVSTAMISAVVKGKKNVSIRLVLGLEESLAIPAEFWLDLQRIHDQTLSYHKLKRELQRLHVPDNRQQQILSQYVPI